MLVVIRGAGDLASGIAYRLRRANFDIIMTEIAQPTCIRQTVAFSTAIGRGSQTVEGVTGRLCDGEEEIDRALDAGEIAVVVDEEGAVIQRRKPFAAVDAILAKRNLGTSIDMAPVVVGVGPGFTAGVDCHYAVETKRGHYLGKVLEEGSPIPNTGEPGNIGGFTSERIIRASGDGVFLPLAAIGDRVEAGQLVARAGESPVYASISGIVRGMLSPGISVTTGFKCGDIDPRCALDHCFTISDKARAIGGGVLEAIMRRIHL